MKKTVIILAALAVGASSCAKNPNQISAAYVSETPYMQYSCSQLKEEAARVSERSAEAIGIQNDKATKDAVAMTVGMVVFWPAIFFVGGDGESAANVSRLKGEMEAIQSASNKKGCDIKFEEIDVEKEEKSSKTKKANA
ncbi:hypothetical protein FF124_14675 [Martelella lutilitoris]|uniref:Lipoprotein n=1 Tax=Martelella lutilitoris TaxID=2583532 RepID=A0A5C4JNM2_9HYPH|nr:hypothetical protein [Martelella lutilitoris]TNB46801.1 hypothetical protein FF124_14675 [Martelella lutilitoris]